MPQGPRVILLSDLSRGFGRGVLAGIARYSALHGRWTFYHRPPAYLLSRRSFDLTEFKRWKPDGVVCSVEQSEALLDLNVPFVCYDPGNYEGLLPCIVTEDDEIGRLAAQHLIDRGQRNFAFCGFGSLTWSKNRQLSFCDHIHKLGLNVTVLKERRANLPWSKEEQLIREWILELPKPVGLFCANDDRATIVAEICVGLGFNIPDDISIIGADNDEILCEVTTPPLSSVSISTESTGYEAASLLSKLIDGKESHSGQRIVAKAAGVCTRQSTDALMVKSLPLKKAIRYIKENMNHQFQVTDVVQAAGLCHRSLNDLFHDELGASIGKYLTSARIEHISHLLVDTDMQVQEIAAAVGYEDDRHFSRYFKRSTGLSPQAYRKKLLAP